MVLVVLGLDSERMVALVQRLVCPCPSCPCSWICLHACLRRLQQREKRKVALVHLCFPFQFLSLHLDPLWRQSEVGMDPDVLLHEDVEQSSN